MTPRPLYKWKSFWFGLCVLAFSGCSATETDHHPTLSETRAGKRGAVDPPGAVPALRLVLRKDIPSGNGGIFPWSSFDLHSDRASAGLELVVLGSRLRRTTTTSYVLIDVSGGGYEFVVTQADDKNDTPSGMIKELKRAGFTVIVGDEDRAYRLLDYAASGGGNDG